MKPYCGNLRSIVFHLKMYEYMYKEMHFSGDYIKEREA